MGKNIFGQTVNSNLSYSVLPWELYLQITSNSVYPAGNTMTFETVEENLILLSF